MQRNSPLSRLWSSVLSLLVLLGIAYAFWSEPENYELGLIDKPYMFAGKTQSITLNVFEPVSGRPVRNVRVKLNMNGKMIAEAFSDRNGTVKFKVKLPEDTGKVKFTAIAGKRRLEWISELLPPYKLLLSSDKPLYQPGQVVHLRGLLLDQNDLKPIPEIDIELEVWDPKGNRLYKKTLRTDKFGVFYLDFNLAPEAKLGTYRVVAKAKCVREELKFDVKRYVLPKFKIELSTDSEYYLPGQNVNFTVNVRYFFGKPVSGDITAKLYTFEAGFHQISKLVGKLRDGKFRGEMKLPEFMTGIPLEGGKALVKLSVEVRDTAGHTETFDKFIKVVKEPIDVKLVPEYGKLVLDMENRIHLLASYPDGKPVPNAQVILQEGSKHRTYRTDKLGYLMLKLVPRSELRVTVRDDKGQQVQRVLKPEKVQNVLALYPSEYISKVGSEIRLSVVSDLKSKVAFIEILKGMQTLDTYIVNLRRGKGNLKLTLKPEYQGTLKLRCYAITQLGEVIGDTRQLIVLPARALRIDLTKDRDVYRPGSEAILTFRTSVKGKPETAALSVAIVDPALLYLAGKDPQLLKLYLYLERQLMEPRYEVHGVSLPYAIKDNRLKLATASVILASHDSKLKFRSTFADTLKELAEKMIEIFYSYKFRNYLSRHDTPPTSLLQIGFKLNQIVDPWDMPIKLIKAKREGKWTYNGFTLISAGPDKKFRTPDDIDMYKLEELLARQGINMHQLIWRMYREEKVFLPMQTFALRRKVLEEAEAPPEALNMVVRGKMVKGRPAVGEGGIDKSQFKVRKYFPETMYFNPEIISENGKAQVELKLADTITDWKVLIFGNTLDGKLGTLVSDLKVFQEFFIDLDLPLYLTRGDEVEVKAVVYNYTDRHLDVKLYLQSEDWFRALERLEKDVSLGPNEVKSVGFRIRALKLGKRTLTLYAVAGKLKDAIQRPIEVIPAGKLYQLTYTGKLEGNRRIQVRLPKGTISDATKLTFYIYPSLVSHVIEGLEGILRMPYGCFEQTTSITYPNALVLDYLRRYGLSQPEIEMKANYYLQVGYQRLISFEVPGGGFEWFGRPPANKLLTAYGIMEFSDMSRVYPVSPDLIERTRRWLFNQMEGDHWTPDRSYMHLETWRNIKESQVTTTAFITWALVISNDALKLKHYELSKLDSAVKWLRTRADTVNDVYTLAFLANALVNYDMMRYGNLKQDTRRLLQKIANLALHDGNKVYWVTQMEGFTFSRGDSTNLEVTALCAQALAKANYRLDLVKQAIDYLISKKDGFGTWYTTQATIQTLRLLLQLSETAPKLEKPVQVKIKVGETERLLEIKPSDLTGYIVTSLPVNSDRFTIQIESSASVPVYWQAVVNYYLRWDHVPQTRAPLKIDVSFDRHQLRLNQKLVQKVVVSNLTGSTLKMVVVDVGLPPGFKLDTSELESYKQEGNISGYDYTGRQVILYIDELGPHDSLSFEWHLKPLFPLKVKPPVGHAYEYYTPSNSTDSVPSGMIIVK